MEQKKTEKTMFDLKIPENIEECFEQLEKQTSFDNLRGFKQTLEGEAVAMSHENPGRFIRNSWGLWKCEGPIAEYFNKLGIYHPDDMSSIIITSFHRHLNNKAIRLDEQVNYYRDYWDKVDPKINKGQIQ